MDPIRYIVETESADGIILNQTQIEDNRACATCPNAAFPSPTHGRTAMGIDHPYFDFDNEAFARIAVRALRRGPPQACFWSAPRPNTSIPAT